jgi:uncharacterized membrane protein
LGWSDWSIFQNAFLLFLTNFAGIVFAAAFTFMVLGFSPLKRAKKGLMISLLVLLLISIPLYFSFTLMVKDAKIKKILEQQRFVMAQREIFIKNLLISHTEKEHALLLRFDLVSNQRIEEREREALKKEIDQKIAPYLQEGEDIVLEISERLRY